MPNIKPISDLRNYSEVLHDVASGEPVFLTKNGRGAYAILDIKDYEKIQAELRIMNELAIGRKAAENEGWLSDNDVRSNFNAKANDIRATGVYSFNEILKKLLPVFSKFKVREATLFGSYAKGSASENSDIDIMVDSGLKGLSFFELLEAASAAIGKPLDLIDKSEIIPNSKIDLEIKKTGVKIYG